MELTRQQIENMPAGREMNLAVAEYVLGYAWGHNSRYGFLRPEEEVEDLVESDSSNYGPHPGGHAVDTFDSYSTSIAAAWQVVEKMQRDYVTSLISETDQQGQLHVGCRIEGDLWTNPEQKWAATADSAPLAICRAALLATLPTPTTSPDAPASR